MLARQACLLPTARSCREDPRLWPLPGAAGQGTPSLGSALGRPRQVGHLSCGQPCLRWVWTGSSLSSGSRTPFSTFWQGSIRNPGHQEAMWSAGGLRTETLGPLSAVISPLTLCGRGWHPPTGGGAGLGVWPEHMAQPWVAAILNVLYGAGKVSACPE